MALHKCGLLRTFRGIRRYGTTARAGQGVRRPPGLNPSLNHRGSPGGSYVLHRFGPAMGHLQRFGNRTGRFAGGSPITQERGGAPFTFSTATAVNSLLS